MAEEKRTFDNWSNLIIDFFEKKVRESKLFKAREYIEKKEIEIKFQKDEKKLGSLKDQISKKETELSELRKQASKNEIRSWLDKISQRKIKKGIRITKATHVLRFTHSSSNPDGILITKKSDDLLLTTSTLRKNIQHDLAHNNGNLITVSRFLSLQLYEMPIIDCILNTDFSFLEPFYKNKEQLKKWESGFLNLVESREMNNAHMAKQIYFPLIGNKSSIQDIEHKYHLIVPLFSSTLADSIYSTITNNKHERIEITKRRNFKDSNGRKSPQYYPKVYVDYPGLAVQKYGGDNPQNVSMSNVNRKFILNKKSFGGAYLFSSNPPSWETQLKPPVATKSFFYGMYGRQIINENIDYLRDFLLRFERIGLSIRAPSKKEWIDSWAINIIEDVIAYAATIRNLPPGWTKTENVKLKKEHQYFLDPYRDNEIFQAERRSPGWQSVICSDFAVWLNGRLKGKEKKFTPQAEHTRMWKNLMEKELREFTQIADAHIHNTVREEV